MVFFVSLASMGVIVILVRSMQSLRRTGWANRRGLLWWNGLLAALMGAYLAYLWGSSLTLTQAVGSVVLGLVAGLVLLAFVKPRWRSNPER